MKSATASKKKSDDKEHDESNDLSDNESGDPMEANSLEAFLSQDNILQGKFGKANKQKLIDSQKGKSSKTKQQKEGPKRPRGRPRKDQSNKEN